MFNEVVSNNSLGIGYPKQPQVGQIYNPSPQIMPLKQGGGGQHFNESPSKVSRTVAYNEDMNRSQQAYSESLNRSINPPPSLVQVKSTLNTSH